MADAAACATEAADNAALATPTGARAALEATAACAGAVTLALGGATAAEAAAKGLGDAAMMVSDPGPVSGTGKGRVATALPATLEFMKKPAPSHNAKAIMPTPTAAGNNQRFDLEALAVSASFAESEGFADGSCGACTAGTDSARPENTESCANEGSTRSRACATLGCGIRIVRSGSKLVSSVGERSAVLLPGLFCTAAPP